MACVTVTGGSMTPSACASFSRAPGSKFENNGGNFVDRVKKKKLRTSFAFVILPVSSNILMSLMESWCTVFVGIQFFGGKI